MALGRTVPVQLPSLSAFVVTRDDPSCPQVGPLQIVTVGPNQLDKPIELGEETLRPPRGPGRWAVTAIAAAWRAASELPGWALVGLWRFVSAVSGGKLIAANTDSPWLIIGSRRFMPPTP